MNYALVTSENNTFARNDPDYERIENSEIGKIAGYPTSDLTNLTCY